MISICRKSGLKVAIVNGECVFETLYLYNLNINEAYNLWSHYHKYSFDTFKTMIKDRINIELGFNVSI